MVISHNISAINIQNQLKKSSDSLGRSTARLSSGYKINSAADNAASLSISEKMRWQIRGLNRASNNIEEGISLVQLTDGALEEAESILQRARELSVQAANDTNTSSDRNAIQSEINECIKEIDRIAETTNFNGVYPLDADDKYALNPTTSTSTTPTPINDGAYLMDSPSVNIISPSGSSKTTTGFELDMSKTNANDLVGKTFFVTCSQNCTQTFEFTFNKGQGSSAVLDYSTKNPSIVVNVDVSGLSGKNIPGVIASLLSDSSFTSAGLGAQGNGNYKIGHANMLYINGSKMTFYPTTGSSSYSTSSYSKTVGSGESAVTYDKLRMGSIYLNGMEKDVIISTESSEWGLNIQSGALGNQGITIPLTRMRANTMGIDPLDVTSYKTASTAIYSLDGALEWLNNLRSEYGAVQNRLEHAYNVDTNTAENTQSAESLLRDTDMSEEMISYSKASVLSSAGQSILAQSNTTAQNVLQLLG